MVLIFFLSCFPTARENWSNWSQAYQNQVMNVSQAGFSTNSHFNLEELVVYYHQIQPELKYSWHFITVHHCISFSLRKLKNICRRTTFRFFNTLCEKCPNTEFVCSILLFSRIRTEYGDLRITSLYSVQIQDISGQKKLIVTYSDHLKKVPF